MGDNESSLDFTEAENKIRKKWLFLSTLLPAAIFGCFIIFSVFILLSSSNFTVILEILLLSLVSAGGTYMNYHCAYKNPGTVLLLCIMIGNLLTLLGIFFKPENLALMKVSPIYLLFVLVEITFEITVFYYSYKLRKINKKIKEKKLTVSPLYINALSVFSTANSLEELNQQFSRLRASDDDSESTVGALAKAYNQRKKMLILT